ncbi:hypothetical protein HZA97_03125 [Candidatus Woesearchaeota archaeon]|nr:hypothetical protein [Candidatus Woesearchaeota archaeon]
MIQTIKAKMQGMTVSALISQVSEFAMTEGVWFAVYAALMNVLDEVIIPFAFAYFGHPILGVAALVGDLDWLTYPLYFVLRAKKEEIALFFKRFIFKSYF